MADYRGHNTSQGCGFTQLPNAPDLYATDVLVLLIGPLGFTPAGQGIMRKLDSAIPVGHQWLTRVTSLCVSKYRVFDI